MILSQNISSRSEVRQRSYDESTPLNGPNVFGLLDLKNFRNLRKRESPNCDGFVLKAEKNGAGGDGRALI
jgi:hypothetical protein